MRKINGQYEPDPLIAWLQPGGGGKKNHVWREFTIVERSHLVFSDCKCFLEPEF